jgi:hypothetical protein
MRAMHVPTRDSPRSFWAVHAGPYDYQNPPSATVLRVVSHPFSGSVACAHGGDPVGLRWSFFSFLSFLSYAIEIRAIPFK